MKKMKKIFALLIAMVMVLGMSTAVFAQKVDTEQGGTATITISNASKGETYAVAKLFDATVSKTVKEDGENTSIAYTGNIPDSLSTYFEKDTAGNISLKDGANISDTAFQDALKTWAAANVTKDIVSDGTELTFTNLKYGYYVITTTQGNGLISVDSTRPNATVIDKNTTPPVNNLSKSADETDVYIGQTVTYTVSFDTSNYYKKDENSDPEQIVTYTIEDTAATGSLTGITVTSIYVDADADLTTTDDQTPLTVQQFADNKIVINWTKDGVAGESLYKNGAKLVIVYTATVADTAAVDGEGNTNKVTVTPKTDKGTEVPDKYEDTETFYTYAIAIKKVDQAGKDLAGATFKFPFYVKATPADDGAYIYAGTEAGEGLVNELTTPDSGLIIVKGVKSGDVEVEETAAPAGYNKLTEKKTVTATKTGATTTNTTTYLDKDGKVVETETEGGSTVLVTINELAATPIVVVNQTGTELPSTGGIGTTIFYIIGAVLVIGAGVVLVTRRRMSANK